MDKEGKYEDCIIEHLNVTWDIKNILHSEDLEKTSFTLQLSSYQRFTLWSLVVIPDLENDFFVLNLKRFKIDRGPKENVHLSFRFGWKDKNQIKWDKETNNYYRKGKVRNHKIYNASNYFDIESKTATLFLQMIVSSMTTTKNAFNKHNVTFQNNMMDAYDQGCLTDLTLLVKNREIKVHKAIIASKSEYFYNKLSNFKYPVSILEFENENANFVENSVRHMYTNAFEFYNEPVFISDYEYAHKFKIKFLLNLLSPTKLTFTSDFRIHTDLFIWDIVCNQTSNSISPNCNLKISSYNLLLAIVDSDIQHYLCLKVESDKKLTDLMFCIGYTILEENKEVQFSRKLIGRIKDGHVLKLPYFIKKTIFFNSESKLICNQTLNLLCKVEVKNLAAEADENQDSNRDQFVSLDKCCEKCDFSNLLKSNDFSDCLLVCENKLLRAHKAILDARCLLFGELLRDPSVNKVFITDLSFNALQSLLFYMYSGKLDENLDSAFELLQIHEKYDAYGLKEQLDEFFTSKCNLSDVCDLLLKADSYKCDNIILVAKDIIMRKFDTFCISADWDRLVTENKRLAQEILTELSEIYLTFYS